MRNIEAKLAVGAMLVLCTSGFALATERHVPSEYATIQAAIDACVDGDIVLVADGTYTGPGNRDLDLAGKAITVQSVGGSGACLIHCENTGRAFYFHSGETSASRIEGFSVQKGAESFGAGACCVNWSSPTIANCVFCYGEALAGGGIYCRLGSSPTIRDCIISENAAEWDGGGIYCAYDSSPTVTGCTITWNVAQRTGGGIYTAYDSNAVISGCAIIANTAHVGGGGGIFCGEDATPVITDCDISDNQALQGGDTCGGGLRCMNGSPTLIRCTLVDNWADLYGGGAFVRGLSNLTLTDCVFDGNWCGGIGGGLAAEESVGVVTGSVFSGNAAHTCGGMNWQSGSLTIANCTFTDNVAYSGDCGGIGAGSTQVQIADCSITDNWAHGAGGALRFWSVGGTIADCVIARNATYGGGGGLFLAVGGAEAELTLTNCVIMENWAADYGGGMVCEAGADSTVEILNSLIADNTADGSDGGGIWLGYTNSPVIRGCTITQNTAAGQGGGVYAGAYNPLPITGCVVWANTPDEIYTYDGQPTVAYCDVQGGWPGDGNIDADPLFVDPLSGDYHLLAGSPCIGAGDPDFFGMGEVDMDGEPRVMGGRVDIGADEFTDEPFVFGDVNCDGTRDFADINPFVLALTDEAGYRAMFPGCFLRSADINGDGSVGFGDINPFVALLSGGR